MFNKNKKNMPHRLLIKIILNIWTIVTIILFFIDFFSGNKFDTSATAIGIIYLAILGIYISEKEYTRWKHKFMSRFIGEGFVIAWTIVMVIFVVLTPFSNGQFKIPSEFAIVYTSVVGAFALSQHSKALYNKK